MANGKAKQAFLDALPETLKGIEHTGESDEVKALVMGIRDSVIAAFEETAPVPPSPVRIQRCDEYVKPGTYKTTWEVVDSRLPGKRRIAKCFDDEAKARDFARRIAPIAGGAYTFEAVDADEYFHDTDLEVVASIHRYGVISGCTLTYDAANMTVDLAAGVVLHSGSVVTVAAASDAYTLVADGSNERWASLTVTSTGVAALLSGDPAANGTSEPAKPEIGDRVLVGMAKIQAAQTIANNCELKLDKRHITHPPSELVAYKTSTQVFTTNTTFADVTASAGGVSGSMAFSIAANEVWEARFIIPVSFGGTGGLKLQLTGPAAPTAVRVSGSYTAHVYDSVGGALTSPPRSLPAQLAGATAFSSSFLAKDSAAEGAGSAQSGNLNNSSESLVVVDVFIANGANAGTVALQAAQNSSNSTTTLAIGTRMTARRLVTA